MYPEPHSTKQIEDGNRVGRRHHRRGAGEDGGGPLVPPGFDVGEAMYRKINCPMLVMHGDDDQLQPYARGKVVAEVTGAELRDHCGRWPQSAGPQSRQSATR